MVKAKQKSASPHATTTPPQAAAALRGRPVVVRWASLSKALVAARVGAERTAQVEERVAAALGVGVKTIRHWVIGEFSPGPARLKEIARILSGGDEEKAAQLRQALILDMPESRRTRRAESRQTREGVLSPGIQPKEE